MEADRDRRISFHMLGLKLICVCNMSGFLQLQDHIWFGFGSVVTAFWERAAHSVNHMCLCIMSICGFDRVPTWFRGRGYGSDCTSPWSLLTFYFLNII